MGSLVYVSERCDGETDPTSLWMRLSVSLITILFLALTWWLAHILAGELAKMRGKESFWEGRGAGIGCPPIACQALSLKVQMGQGWRLVTCRHMYRTEQLPWVMKRKYHEKEIFHCLE